MVSRKSLILLLMVLSAMVPALALAQESDSGSAKLNVIRTLFVAGNEIKPGDYNVTWKSNTPEVAVTFKMDEKAVVQVRGKIEMVERRFDFNSVRSLKDSSGRDLLKAIEFGGKPIRIIFE